VRPPAAGGPGRHPAAPPPAGDDADRGARDAGGGCLLGGVFALLVLAWGLGTPVLAYGAMIASAPFFGEQPTAEELAQTHRLLLGALACGVLVPLAGVALALWSRRKAAAIGFAAALVISLLAGTAAGLVSKDAARMVRDGLLPPTSTSVPGPGGCQEHSGGDNRCPGG
jgi:hypothetical protein